MGQLGFTPMFCRKSDPESKGLIENVVKYVKYNFLRGREFTDIQSLNTQCTGWLDRTANGTVHHGIRCIPTDEFREEKQHLLPYNGIPTPPVEEMKAYHVGKDKSPEDMANRSKEDQIRELKAALKKAQKEAELEKLRAKAYDKMIDLAEERFNIPIRKKTGTKQ